MNEHFLAASLIFGLIAAPTPAAPPVQADAVQFEQVGDGNCPDGTCPRRPVVNAVKAVAEPVKAVVTVPAKVVQAVADCPNGRCPAVRKVQTVQPARNWNYYGSGTLASHVERDHGVSTQGMTASQVQALHNQLHEGQVYSAVNRSHVVKQPVRTALRRLFRR